MKLAANYSSLNNLDPSRSIDSALRALRKPKAEPE